ncbi:MAG: helix-turn-helix domain-containing protein [Verrucomicrobia bacterium]|nr:helix-turn-helix domain-containing protein [Verrucomicrobiota bacterium]
MAQFDTDRPDFSSYGLSCVRWNPSPMRRPDHHNEIQLNMLRRGRVTYLLGAKKICVQLGHLTAFWAAIPHQIIDYERDTEYFVATLPLAWFLQSQQPDSLVQPLMRGEAVAEPQEQRAEIDAALFKQWETDLSAATPAAREIVAQEMEIRLRRLGVAMESGGAHQKPRKPAKLQPGGLNKVEKMMCYIAQNYLDPITVIDIGEAVDLHPNSAVRIFRKTFGTTLIEHLTHHRIFHAKRLLATTDQKIVDVAFSSGFGSISRFNEAFLRACGCSPRAYRKQHEGGG